MLLAALALAAALDLAPRPTDLVHKGEEATYALQLDSVLDSWMEDGAKGSCPPGATTTALGSEPLGPASTVLHVTPDADIAPDAIVYRERFHIAGCGRSARQDNILVVRQKAGGWYMTAFVPGETQVSPVLFRELAPMLIQAARSDEPPTGCANGDSRLYQLMDTERVGPPAGALESGRRAWRERWIQRGCGADRSVLVDFATAPDGHIRVAVTPDWSPSAASVASASGAGPHP
ncbi:MAG: hypothetical protein E7812_15105 [Phenylobacterium sp.]|nr:MAG: hypothetical protein E7812_15105 [Phenylobacterium sp.]